MEKENWIARKVKYALIPFIKQKLINLFSDEEIYYECRKREFNDISVGDVVLAYGTDKIEEWIVHSKSEYSCHLLSVKTGESGLPMSSVTRSYGDIITKIYN